MITTLLVAAALATPKLDTAKTFAIGEVTVVSSIKENNALRLMPISSTIVDRSDIEKYQIGSLKNVSAIAPNLFIPDYGSRLTSAIYIRGIGSRINTPAVGLYVDNMPQIDKSAYDFEFADIERIDVLRGPQSTLYGRNAMGGIVKIHTASPFSRKGTTLDLGFATRNNQRKASLTHYLHMGDKVALSLNGHYEGNDGLFRNSLSGRKEDDRKAGGGRLRLMARPTSALTFDFNASYDYTDEGAYPYYYAGAAKGYDEEYAELIGKISNNRPSSYRRGVFNSGLSVNWQADDFTLSSVTSYQNLNDRMTMDQDFLPKDIFTLEQRQRINTISQELALRYGQHITGASFFYQWLRTESPVRFRKDGVSWLENNVNSHMPAINIMGIPATMGVDFSANDELNMGGTFQTPALGASLFHQSTVKLTDRLDLTAGLRLDYEKQSMDYNAPATILYNYVMQGPSPAMSLTLNDKTAHASFVGTTSQDFVHLLPKASLKWNFNTTDNIYASFSKGMRSGGYNVQMFSDILEQGIRISMMKGIKAGAEEFIANSNMPSFVSEKIEAGLGKMPIGNDPDVAATTRFKPEYSWNTEVGTHLSFDAGATALTVDAAVFYISTHDQQITRFADSGLGRFMVNAGRSRSYGAELSVVAHTTLSDNTTLNYSGNYGYTNATFTSYSASDSVSYNGNHIPFAPLHTLNLNFGATHKTSGSLLKAIVWNVGLTGAGRIYWNEANTMSEPFFTTLNATLAAEFSHNVDLTLWAHNIAGSSHATFAFTSMNRNFEQRSRPFQMGADLKIRF